MVLPVWLLPERLGRGRDDDGFDEGSMGLRGWTEELRDEFVKVGEVGGVGCCWRSRVRVRLLVLV